MDKRTETNLIKVTLQNRQLLEHVCNMLVDQTISIVASMKNCDNCHNTPATTHHSKYDIELCDRCCAEIIYLAKKGSLDLKIAKLDLLIAATKGESSWLDKPGASAIRRIMIFFDQFKHVEAPTVH